MIHDYFKSQNFYYIPEIIPIQISRCEDKKKRINLLIPTINQKESYGGISTAILFFESIVHNFQDSKEFDFRIICTDSKPDDIAINKYSEYFFGDSNVNLGKKTLCSINDRTQILSIRENDFFIATAWWTAFIAEKFIIDQAKEYNKGRNRLIYFIQDFEPSFYPISYKYLASESTYSNNIEKIAVFNSSFLYNYFKKSGYLFYKEFYFEPKISDSLKKHINLDFSTPYTRKILIYGRPSVPRNGFPLILEGLKKWAQCDEKAKKYDIISAGELHSDIHITEKMLVRSLGKLGLEEYAEILKESAIGISLMFSPHPSYPPLEMASFGMYVITNKYENKDLAEKYPNIYSMRSISPDSICELLLYLSNMVESNMENHKHMMKRMHSNEFVDQPDIFDFIPEMISYL